jgi:hypothetical protein
MRTLVCLLAVGSVIFGGLKHALAQQPEPATLENLLKSDEPQANPAGSKAEATPPSPKRPAGTLSRPADGVQHPTLDKAWAEYDATVSKTAESIRAAIAKQFDAATAKGDLDAAEKWQTLDDKFREAGEVPAEPETKTAVSAAIADYKKAKEELAHAYEALVKSLTMEKKIEDAKTARDEWRALSREKEAKSSSNNGLVKPRMMEQFLVEALIDGDSELCVTPKGIYWRSLGVAKPGRHGGKNEPTFVNGQPWIPLWGQPNQERGNDQSALLALPIGDVNLGFELVAVGLNRGDKGIIPRSRIQSRSEADKFVIAIPDKDNGSLWYTIRVFRNTKR